MGSLKEDYWIIAWLLFAYENHPTVVKIRKMDFTFTLSSFLFLTVVRLVIFQVLIAFGWPVRSKMTTDAASSLTSILHSTMLCSWLIVMFAKLGFRNYIPSCKLSSHDKDFQQAANACLEFCTGYMFFDAFFLIKDSYQLGIMPLTDFEMLVLGHHVFTSFYMISCRVVEAGHLSAMILMLTGEISNPLMNGMFVTRFAIQLECCRSENMILLHTFLEHAFAVVYVIFRIFIGPICAIHLVWDILFSSSGRQNIPTPLSVIWVLMILVVIVGSGPFVMEAVDMLRDGFELKFTPDYDYGERFRIQQDEL